jgi:alpha/beta superfamily hydrolase
VARRIESHLLEGPAGPLEALLEEPEDQAPRAAVLVCHPHPLYGGTMHNKVVYRMAKAMRRWGAVVLRFNFRGAGRSGGEHAHGRGEVEDAQAALAWLRERYPALPYTLAGFSFGARVCLELGCRNLAADPPCRIVVAGFPTRLGGTAYLESCPIPKFFVQSTNDEHGPRPDLERLFAGFAEPKRIVWVEANDHLFAGGLQQLEQEVFGLGAC